MFKRLPIIALACVLLASVAQATPVRIDFRSTIGRSAWTDATWATTGEIQGTILLDTVADSSSSTINQRSDGQSVVGEFRFSGVRVLGMSALFAGNSLFDLTEDAFTHSFSGEAPGLSLYESFFGGTSAAGGYQLALPLTAVVSAADFASFPDAILALLTSAPLRGAGSFSGFGDFGSFGGSLSYLSIQEIPEPATLGLMAIGLAGFASFGLRRKQLR